MSKNRYYLFYRDIDKNVVGLIPLSDLDVYGYGDNYKVGDNSLDKIDFYTMNFDNKKELIGHLVDIGVIDNYNSDLFIVSRNGDKISFLENIYYNDELARDLKFTIGEKIKKGSFTNMFDSILDTFAYMMTNDRRFREFIESKYHRVYSKYVDYFNNCFYTNDAYKIKYKDSSWARSSYSLARNIIEVINRYNNIKDKKGNISDNALEYDEVLNHMREKNSGDISFYTDKNYALGQLDLFGYSNDLFENDKYSYVMEYINKIGVDSFVIENGDVILNNTKYNKDNDNLVLFNSYDSTFKRNIYLYSVYNAFSDDYFYKDLLSSVKDNISNSLKNNELLLNRFYAFCISHEKYVKTNSNNKILQI